jgi:hypothetical protein
VAAKELEVKTTALNARMAVRHQRLFSVMFITISFK